MNVTHTFQPSSRANWREWLRTHHDTESEIWVVLYKKASGKQTITLNEVIDEALCFGWQLLTQGLVTAAGKQAHQPQV